MAANLNKLTQNPDLIKMNWLIIALDATFAMIAAFLSNLNHETFKSLKNLVFGKYFWLFVFFSGVILVSSVRIFQVFAFEHKWAGV